MSNRARMFMEKHCPTLSQQCQEASGRLELPPRPITLDDLLDAFDSGYAAGATSQKEKTKHGHTAEPKTR